MFRLDKTKFQIRKKSKANPDLVYQLSNAALERLNAAWYLTCSAYNLDYRVDQKMEKTLFTIKKRD